MPIALLRPSFPCSCFFLFLFCFLSSPLCLASTEQPIGFVAVVRGNVIAIDGSGTQRSLVAKDTLYISDTVKTISNGRVQLVFIDKTIISLGRNSALKIADYAWSDESKKGVMTTVAGDGVFRFMGGAITKYSPKKFTTQTPLATIGVRGSMYSCRVSGRSLQVLFDGGKGVDVSNSVGSVALTIPGQGTTVNSATRAPRSARIFSAREAAAFQVEFDMGGSGGSTLRPGTQLRNSSSVTNSSNVAIGKNSRVHMGAISIRDSIVGGDISNESDVRDSANVAVGADTSANTGSIVIE